MITLYVLLVLAFSIHGSQGNANFCSSGICFLSNNSKGLDYRSPHTKNLFLKYFSELEVLKFTPNLVWLKATNCSSDFNMEISPEMPHLKVIRIQNCHISELGKYQFEKVMNLADLRLENNNIERISNETFYQLSSLKSLYLHNNLIKDLPGGVFYPLGNLFVLFLSYNNISILPENLFSRNTKLGVINLSGNPLKAIYLVSWTLDIVQISLKDCSQLRDIRLIGKVRYLHLENTGVERLQISGGIYSRIYHKNSRVTQADFHGTFFENAIVQVLCDMPSLEWLDLSNSSSSIHNSGFDWNSNENRCNFPNLRFLNLSDSKFKYLPKSLPLFGPNLATLDLSHNLLENVSLESFAEAQSLQRLYLEGNLLTSFDYLSVCGGLKNLKELTLYDNRFNATFYSNMSKYFGDTDLRLILKENRIFMETGDQDEKEHLISKANQTIQEPLYPIENIIPKLKMTVPEKNVDQALNQTFSKEVNQNLKDGQYLNLIGPIVVLGVVVIVMAILFRRYRCLPCTDIY